MSHKCVWSVKALAVDSFAKIHLSALAALAMLFFAPSVFALSIVDERVWFFLDNQQPTQPIPGIGENKTITIGARIDGINDFVSGTVTHVPSGTTADLINLQPIFGFPNVSVDVPFTEPDDNDKKDGGDWVMEVSDASGPADAHTAFPDLSNVEFMDTPEKMGLVGNGSNFEVTWQLPTSGPTVDYVRLELFNLRTDTLLGAVNLPGDATSFSINLSSSLDDQMTGEFGIRPIAVNTGGNPNATSIWDVVTRSSNWWEVEVKPPQASGTGASLTAGSPISISQAIDTPNLPFTVSFEYLFTTLTGELVVLLDGVPIGNPLSAPGTLGTEFLTAYFEVDNSLLLGQDNLLLTFLLDGVTGSQVLLDNISGPGILNGTFEGGLTAWQADGPGIVGLVTIPEPNSTLLMMLGFLGLGLFSERKLFARSSMSL